MQITLNKRTTFTIIFLFFIVFYTIQYLQQRDIYFLKSKFTTIKNIRNTRNWYNFEFMLYESARRGPGECGEEVFLTDPAEVRLNGELFQKTGFSVIVSNKISVNRSLPQIVDEACQEIEYLSKLPSTSVIIIFNNEVFSVLLRTVHSVFNRTPRELLHEIILVNDKSSDEQLYGDLQKYVLENFPKNLIKIKNLPKRSGLIVARMEGARLATGEVLMFFDSHIEVHHNWLPPLLEPLVMNEKLATLPIVDYFSCETFGYINHQEKNQGTRGIIDWFLDFHELPKLPHDQINNLKPFPNPIMLGCAFAINRKFFLYELGGYDEELRIWNGENYELSFKLWMCRDGILTVPCSRVAHSFRTINPSRKFEEDYVARNFKRIAEVWLDEFKTLPYKLEPKRYENVDEGNLTAQHDLRKRLQCKSFRWFLENVAPDMFNEYPPLVPLPVFASGAVQNVANPRFCLDNLGSMFGEKIGIFECANDLVEPEKNQKFHYTFYKDLRQINLRDEFCLDAYMLKMTDCNRVDFGNQFWKYDLKQKGISVKTNDNGVRCLTLFLTNDTIGLNACNGEQNQQWSFGYINETAYEHFQDTFGYSNIVSL